MRTKQKHYMVMALAGLLEYVFVTALSCTTRTVVSDGCLQGEAIL